VIPRIVSLVDVMPTILALAGLPAVEGTQGENVSAFLDGRDDATKDLATFATAVKWKPALYSARTDHYKLIKDVNLTTGKELYDLRKDSAEANNVEERESSALKSMEGALATFFAENERRETLEPGSAEIPPDVQERLRALGYDQKRQAE
jgi:arylsulfatase A-like enzyme